MLKSSRGSSRVVLERPLLGDLSVLSVLLLAFQLTSDRRRPGMTISWVIERPLVAVLELSEPRPVLAGRAAAPWPLFEGSATGGERDCPDASTSGLATKTSAVETPAVGSMSVAPCAAPSPREASGSERSVFDPVGKQGVVLPKMMP
jgi:hypothetical protein